MRYVFTDAAFLLVLTLNFYQRSFLAVAEKKTKHILQSHGYDVKARLINFQQI